MWRCYPAAVIKAPAAVQVSHVTPYRYVLGLLFCSYLTAFIDRGLVSAAGAPIKHDLSLSDTQFGLLSGPAFVALYCICGVPLGWLADRTERKTVIAFGLLVWSMMTAVCATVSSFSLFFIARVGVGFGEACLVPAGISLLGSVAPRTRVAQSVAIFIMGATAGNALALLAGGQFLDQTSFLAPLIPGIGSIAPWRALFVLAAVPGIALAFLVIRIREPARAPSLGRPWDAMRTALALIYVNRAAYAPVTLATACVIVLSQTQATWMTIFYVRAFQLSPGMAAWIVGIMFLVSAPTGQWLGGVLMDRLRAIGIPAAPLFVQAAGAILCIPAAVIFCTSKRLLASEASYIVFNMLVFAATPAGLSAWQLLTPQRSQGLVVAVLVAIVTLLGVGVGPVLVGTLTDHLFRDESAVGTSLLLVIVGAGVVGFLAAISGIHAFTRSMTEADSTVRLLSLP